MPEIRELCHEAHATSTRNGFWEDKDNGPISDLAVLARLMLVTTEVAEAAEAVRHADSDNFVEELADACIRLFDLSAAMEVDLQDAILAKMARNQTRPYKHGKSC